MYIYLIKLEEEEENKKITQKRSQPTVAHILK